MIDLYCHTSPSGKHYVGVSSKGMNSRWAAHVRAAKAGSTLRFHHAIRKYGPEAFVHEVLERLTTSAGARRAEQLWIRELSSFGRGYNATTGGEGLQGFSHTATSIDRMRLAQKSRGSKGRDQQAKALRGRTGHKHSESALEKMAAAARARGASGYEVALSRAHTPEARARGGTSRRGVRLTAEHCANLSRAHTGSTQSEYTRAKRSAALRGRKRPPEVCAKISATKRKNRP
jgi:group I intron endonuclease